MNEKKMKAYLIETENLGVRVFLARDSDEAKKLAIGESPTDAKVELVREITELTPFETKNFPKKTMYNGKIFLSA